jgi:hypothetical protein
MDISVFLSLQSTSLENKQGHKTRALKKQHIMCNRKFSPHISLPLRDMKSPAPKMKRHKKRKRER